jgi:hypothetical protein
MTTASKPGLIDYVDAVRVILICRPRMLRRTRDPTDQLAKCRLGFKP